MYRETSCPPLLIDLSGGSPDLVPEWVPWMMAALKEVGLDRTTYLWSDDNLSTTYLFDELLRRELDVMTSYPNYGRVCCFKGFDGRSFAFNTRAAEEDFGRQLDIMQRVLATGIDVYGYVTLTAPDDQGNSEAMPRFLDSLQALDPNLPLRVVPLEIAEFNPVKDRMPATMLCDRSPLSLWRSPVMPEACQHDRAL